MKERNLRKTKWPPDLIRKERFYDISIRVVIFAVLTIPQYVNEILVIL